MHVEDNEDYFLEDLTVITIAADHWSAVVNIEGKAFTCKLDTGANCCVISQNDQINHSKLAIRH